MGALPIAQQQRGLARLMIMWTSIQAQGWMLKLLRSHWLPSTVRTSSISKKARIRCLSERRVASGGSSLMGLCSRLQIGTHAGSLVLELVQCSPSRPIMTFCLSTGTTGRSLRSNMIWLRTFTTHLPFHWLQST
uniref:Uncharacterized protein n=1 Tax=uncultured marine virus TaxID=186617 RepID=A0A0F7L6U6_9VIRU|nr:hypothetical protein [uncultured marine virus]